MRISVRTMAAAAAAFMLFATLAAAQSSTLTASVPFQFIVEGKTLPAGNYTLQVDNFSRRVLLLPGTGKDAFFLAPIIGRSADMTGERAALVFHKYGDTYFLRHAWAHGQTERLEWPEPKAERELQKAGSPVEVALYHPLIK